MTTHPRIISRLFIAVALNGLLLIASASGQWDKKQYVEWSQKEAQKVLDDSPWGQTLVVGETAVVAGTSRTEEPSYINFRVRFLSAKPIRRALSRIVELRQKGGTSEQLSARLKSFADANFPDYVVVTVAVDSEQNRANFVEANTLLYKATTPVLKNNTYLDVKGKRVFLQEYQPPQNDGFGARFIFPRLVDGQPFITPEGGEVRFYSELSKTYTLNMRYKIKNMVYEGKLEY